jgi:predicted metal-binding membrane protein
LGYDKKYLIWALFYLAAGMALGIFMAATHDHGQLVTHTHINLAGFLLSLSYGIIHKLWLAAPHATVAKVQFILQQAASIPLFIGLFLLYGHIVPEAQIEPVLSVSSIALLISALIMLYMVIKSNAAQSK